MKNKRESAAYLNVSTRKIERYVTEGKLTPQYRTGPRGREAVYDDAQLDRLKRERETPITETVRPSTALVRRPSSGLVAPRRGSPETTPHALADLHVQLALTVEQAAQLAGLGIGTIEQAIRDGALVAREIGPRGARVMLREHVERYARELFDVPAPARQKRRRT